MDFLLEGTHNFQFISVIIYTADKFVPFVAENYMEILKNRYNLISEGIVMALINCLASQDQCMIIVKDYIKNFFPYWNYKVCRYFLTKFIIESPGVAQTAFLIKFYQTYENKEIFLENFIFFCNIVSFDNAKNNAKKYSYLLRECGIFKVFSSFKSKNREKIQIYNFSELVPFKEESNLQIAENIKYLSQTSLNLLKSFIEKYKNETEKIVPYFENLISIVNLVNPNFVYSIPKLSYSLDSSSFELFQKHIHTADLFSFSFLNVKTLFNIMKNYYENYKKFPNNFFYLFKLNFAYIFSNEFIASKDFVKMWVKETTGNKEFQDQFKIDILEKNFLTLKNSNNSNIWIDAIEFFKICDKNFLQILDIQIVELIEDLKSSDKSIGTIFRLGIAEYIYDCLADAIVHALEFDQASNHFGVDTISPSHEAKRLLIENYTEGGSSLKRVKRRDNENFLEAIAEHPVTPIRRIEIAPQVSNPLNSENNIAAFSNFIDKLFNDNAQV